ncbi:MAG: hypothetical protein WAM58_01130 [Candidatus Acidiferrum sp.]
MPDATPQVIQSHSFAPETSSVVRILTEAFKQFVLDLQNYAKMSALSLTKLALLLADIF